MKAGKKRYHKHLTNNRKKNGEKFKSANVYVGLIDSSLKIMGINESLFYSNSEVSILEKWYKKLKKILSHALQSTNETIKKYARQHIYAFGSYLNFAKIK